MKDIDKTIEEAKAEVLPYECWDILSGEKSDAYAAFCVYRDFGADRNIRKAVEELQKSNGCTNKYEHEKLYRKWRIWAAKYRWQVRAADYDRYLENLKQTELRKTIEAQGEMHRTVTGKMLDVVNKKLDTMNPEDLTQGNVTEWASMAIKADREAAGLVTANGKTETKQGELSFVSDFQGL
jgi:hypothetical protein